MKHLFSLHLFVLMCAALMIPMSLEAQEVTLRLPLMSGGKAVDSIDVKFYYYPSWNKAEVDSYTYTGVNSGVLTLPASIEGEGVLYPLKEIRSRAFVNCTALTGIILPSSITSIYDFAFRDCNNLESVNWEDLTALEYIFSSAFLRSGLKRVMFPASLLQVSTGAFGDCFQLSEIDFGKSKLEYLQGNTFSGCALQGELHLPEGLQSIGNRDFANNIGLTKVYLPTSLNSMYSSAFADCSNVTDVYFQKQGESTQWLNANQDFGTGSDYNCSVTLHVSQNVLDACVADTRTDNFQRWYNACPNSIEASLPIGPGYSPGLLEIDLLDANGDVTGSVKAAITIENNEEGSRAMSIGQYVESSVTGAGILALPDSVTFRENRYAISRIEKDAFANCSGITGVRFPISLKRIDINAFLNCPISGRIVFPEGMTYVAGFGVDMLNNEEEFESLPHITSIVLPSTVDTIGDYAFMSNEIDTLIIPASCQYIGRYAFYNSNNLRSLTFEGNNLDAIAPYAFAGHWRMSADVGYIEIRRSMKVKSIIFPEGLIEIGPYAFYANDSLETVILPASLQRLDEYCFYYTYDLSTVVLPETSQLEHIGNFAFGNSNLSLSELRFPETLTYIGGSVFSNSSPKELFIPKSVGMTGPTPWRNIAFEKLIFEDGFRFAYRTTLGTYHFASDTLSNGVFDGSGGREGSTLVLPEGLICLEGSCLSNARLDSVHLPSTLREIGDYAFAQTGLKRPLHIPESVRIIGEFAFNRNYDELKAYFHQTHPDSVVWRSTNGNDFATPANTTIYVDRSIYNQCKAGVREDAFQYWFDYGGICAMQKLPEPVHEIEVLPQPAPDQEEPVEVLQFDFYEGPTGVINSYALENTVVENVLYNILPDEGDSVVTEVQEGGEDEFVHVLQIASTMSIEEFTNAVANCIPGTAAWADNFSGISFMIPAGEGTMTLDLKVTGDFKLIVYVGLACTVLTANEQGTVNVDYECMEDTWVHIFGNNENPEPNDGLQTMGYRLRAKSEVVPDNYARIRSISISPKQNHSNIENVKMDNEQAKIFIENGVIYLMYKGIIYNMEGKQQRDM